jgi:hypothetical protein
MPELYSRMDDANWLTPSIADILEQGAPPPGGDGSIRDYMLTIQRELADLETPAKIINVRSMPSYTLYVARPETVGRLGNRRTVTPQEIRRSLARIAESHSDWLLGFIPRLQEDENSVGILLRTSAHRPLSLRRLLVRGNFRAAPAFHSFTLGITLEQNLIVRDFTTTPHLLIVGADNAKLHFLRSLLLTLVLLNTPSELRIIMAGRGVDNLKALIASPHSLGRIVNEGQSLQKILDGLATEARRRAEVFEELGVNTLDEYNAATRETKRSHLPHILVVLDAVTDPEWDDIRSSLQESLLRFINSQQDYGIHFFVTIPDPDQEKTIQQAIHTHVVMRAHARGFADQVPDFHPSLLRFVDAMVLEHQGDRNTITPVELCSTSNTELINGIAYWQQTRQQRQLETRPDNPISGRTGVTDLLSFPEPGEEALTPPTRELTGTHAASSAPTVTQDVVQPSQATTQTAPTEVPDISANAIALAAYLGWLSPGALTDIFGISRDYAEILIEHLKSQGVLEQAPHPTPRFLRR